MAIEVIWSEFAKFQLKEIFIYYKRETSLQTAKKITSEITKEVKILKLHIELGQKEELITYKPNNYRYLVKGNYKLIYTFDEENNFIKIVDVFDCRQNSDKINRSK
jgi:plasmid stabilization system protein ParE